MGRGETLSVGLRKHGFRLLVRPIVAGDGWFGHFDVVVEVGEGAKPCGVVDTVALVTVPSDVEGANAMHWHSVLYTSRCILNPGPQIVVIAIKGEIHICSGASCTLRSQGLDSGEVEE